MCSSPKSSTTRRHRVKKIVLNKAEYEEYACMVRRASACYEEAQQRKAERRQKKPNQLPAPVQRPLEVSKYDGEKRLSIFSNIKAFLIQPMMLKTI
jgi:hypothetical protein